MSLHKGEVTDKIERLEVFEEKYDVRFDSLSAFQSYDEDDDEFTVKIFGELYARAGTSIDQDLDIIAALYDEEGKLIQLESNTIYKDDFFGFYAFHLHVWSVVTAPSRIRLYVRPS